MSTNYYWLPEGAGCLNPCEHCSHDQQVGLHIGKASRGVEFLFRGHFFGPGQDIISRADYGKRFSNDPGKIIDENGATIETGQFWEVVRGSGPLIPGPEWESPEAVLWRDPEGFAFTDAEFS